MSGGSFDYAYFKAQQFADDLECSLADPNFAKLYDPEVVRRMRCAVDIARQTAVLMKEVEWLVSGDTSDDTFIARTNNIEQFKFTTEPTRTDA